MRLIMSKTIIKINNVNYCITENGRFRRNWKKEFHKKYLRGKVCEKCGSDKNLTLHFEPPLSIEINNNKKI